MRRTTIRLAIVAAIVALIAAPVAAKKPTTPSVKPAKTTVAKTQAPKAPKTTTVQAKAPKAPKAAKAPKASAPKSAKATSPKGTSKRTATPDTASTPTSAPTPTTPTEPVWTNAVSEKLSTKPNHLTKLQSVLGVTTLTPEQINGATSGFKNWGQFNAAMNTSLNNPNVDFAKLKALMTGLDMTGEPVPGQIGTFSLGQAKKQLEKTTTTAPPSGGTE